MRLAIVIQILLFPIHLAAADEFNGDWWERASYQRKIGFLNGESDCYQYVLKGQSRRFRSIQYTAAQLDRYYSSPNRESVPIQDALRELPPNPERAPSGGQSYFGRHGYYDGQWWLEVESEGHNGFVEGYLSCIPNGRERFLRTFQSYALLVDEWYEKNPARTSIKIADVLELFTSKQSKPK